MGDITLRDPMDIVATDVISLKDKDFSYGVHCNTGKCEKNYKDGILYQLHR